MTSLSFSTVRRILAGVLMVGSAAQAATTTVTTGGAFNGDQPYTNGVNDTVIFNSYNIVLQGAFTNDGRVINNNLLYVNGPLTNRGSFDSKAELVIQGSAANAAVNQPGGIVNLTGPLGLSRSFANAGIVNLVPAVGGESAGASLYRYGSKGKLVNTGTFKIDTDIGESDVPIVNSGTFEITERGNLTLSAPYTQTAGETVLNGNFIVPSSSRFSGGRLRGTGSINVTIASPAVTVMPGSPYGTLTLDAYVALGAAVDIELSAKPIPGNEHRNDQLHITTFLDLGSNYPTLNVNLREGFIPEPGDSFVVVKCDGQNGQFGGIWGQFSETNLPKLPEPSSWTVTYTSSSVILEVH